MASFGRTGILSGLAAMIVALHSAIITAARAFGDFAMLAFAYLLPDTPRFALPGFGTAPIGSGVPIDLALQHSMRHEAGVPRLAADRHT